MARRPPRAQALPNRGTDRNPRFVPSESEAPEIHSRARGECGVKLFLKRNLAGFTAADDAAKEAIAKYAIGEVYAAEIKKPRNYKFHCLVMALLNLTFENQDRYTSFESFRKAVAIEAGHCEELVLLTGEVVKYAKSISYAALDDIEFGRVFADMMTVCAKILGDIGIPELER